MSKSKFFIVHSNFFFQGHRQLLLQLRVPVQSDLGGENVARVIVVCEDLLALLDRPPGHDARDDAEPRVIDGSVLSVRLKRVIDLKQIRCIQSDPN